jgi:polyisoprenoid-binding protein YceI
MKIRIFLLKISSYFFILVSLLSFKPANSKWKLKKDESFIVFNAKNLGLNVSGKMEGMKVTADYNETDIFKSSFEGSVETATIDTKNGLRNNHLKSDDYFDVKKYPTINFKSKKIFEGGAVLAVIGDLTIIGVTKEVKINFVVKKKPESHTFIGDITIQRKDFALGMKSTLIMADEIKVRIFATFVPE